MSEDCIDLTDDPCPKCGNMMVSKVCNDCGGDGCTEYGELYEMDPLWYGPEDIQTCETCRGLCGWVWCQKCGWDETEKRFLNGNPAIELPNEKCPTCGGEGAIDSGGFTPWGSGIMIACPSCSKPNNPLTA